jgi:hypothetical protein
MVRKTAAKNRLPKREAERSRSVCAPGAAVAANQGRVTSLRCRPPAPGCRSLQVSPDRVRPEGYFWTGCQQEPGSRVFELSKPIRDSCPGTSTPNVAAAWRTPAPPRRCGKDRSLRQGAAQQLHPIRCRFPRGGAPRILHGPQFHPQLPGLPDPCTQGVGAVPRRRPYTPPAGGPART